MSSAHSSAEFAAGRAIAGRLLGKMIGAAVFAILLASTVPLITAPSALADSDQPDSASIGSPDSSQSVRKPFQLKVDHSETMPALPESLSIGKELDPESLTGLTPTNIWFVIPGWIAGSWHSDSQTIKYMHDFQSGLELNFDHVQKEAGGTSYGMQRDKTGQIWNFIKVPRTEKQAIASGFAYLQTKREELVNADANQVVIKYQYDQIVVDRKNHIQSVKQVEAINTYTPLEDGLVRLQASLRSFAPDGSPQIEQQGEKLLTRTAPYAEVDKDGDRDLKQLFGEYLKSHGKADLVL